jgi:hypothetical protein
MIIRYTLFGDLAKEMSVDECLDAIRDDYWFQLI